MITVTAKELEYTALDLVGEYAYFLGDNQGDEIAKEIKSILAILPQQNVNSVVKAMAQNGKVNGFIANYLDRRADSGDDFEAAWAKLVAKINLPTEVAQWVKDDWQGDYTLMLDDYNHGYEADDEEWWEIYPH